MVTKLTLEYDGTEFAGWARQPGLRSVQEELERVLRAVLGDVGADGEPLKLTVAGRTDRGVHAWGQVASYAHEAIDPLRLNGLLAGDVAVLAAEPKTAGFDARRDATSRTYCYRVLNRRARSAIERRRALWWPRRLDVEALDACARALLGVHDFTGFTPSETKHTRFEREILRAEWLRGGDAGGDGSTSGGGVGGGRAGGGDARGGGARGGNDAHVGEGSLELWIEADTFMRHMNRILVGTMLEVASGRRTLAEFEQLLEGRPRAHAGLTAPAHGLALVSVAYPPGV